MENQMAESVLVKLTDVNAHTNDLISKHLTDQNNAQADKIKHKISAVENDLTVLKRQLSDPNDKNVKAKMQKLEKKLDGLQSKLEHQ
jgi:hypothetical protein